MIIARLRAAAAALRDPRLVDEATQMRSIVHRLAEGNEFALLTFTDTGTGFALPRVVRTSYRQRQAIRWLLGRSP